MDAENILTPERIEQAIEVLRAIAFPDNQLPPRGLLTERFKALSGAIVILDDLLTKFPAQRDEPQDNPAESVETMTVEGIAKEKWKAVDLPLPPSPSRELLIACREAAEACADEAYREWRHHDPEDAESVGHAAEMQWVEENARKRAGEAAERLKPTFRPAEAAPF